MATGHYVREPSARGRVTLRDVTVVDTADGTRTPHQDIRVVDGIVGYRQMAGSSQLLSDRTAGRLPEFLAAPALLGMCCDLLTPMNAATPEAARQAVSSQQAEGADFVKSAMTTPETYIAALVEARRVGIPLVGHLPDGVDPREASLLGMRSIEHLGPGAAMFEATTRNAPARDSQSKAPRFAKLPKNTITGADRLFARIIANIVVNPAARSTLLLTQVNEEVS